jgi:chaperonin GroES
VSAAKSKITQKPKKEADLMNLKPLGDRIVVKVLEAEDKTASGIVLPDKAKEKPQEGEVMAVGTGKVLDNGTRLEMELKTGDKVIFSRYAGTEVKVKGEEYLILRQDDVLALVQ